MLGGFTGMEPNKLIGDNGKVKLLVLRPGHFHAALVQKEMYDQIDAAVHIYAPPGEDLTQYLDRIEQFNTRPQNPTRWRSRVHAGEDYLEKMIKEKAGNVVVLAGNNVEKIKYIQSSINAGLHVLADKPMVINPEGFELLQKTFNTIRGKDVVLYDIMTERYNIFSILQRDFSMIPELFGDLQQGTPGAPAITMESVHHFFKEVSGKPLIRPPWYFDVRQQGEGIVDVSTHYVDLILWECFPGEGVSAREAEVISARRWPTRLTRSQFSKVTILSDFPEYLQSNIEAGILSVYSNGEFVFRIRDVYCKISVRWNFEAPEGGGDTHLSLMRGTKASLVIRQGREQGYRPALYVEPVSGETRQRIAGNLESIVAPVTHNYPGITFRPVRDGWEVVIPEKYKVGHEAHFSQVMKKYLQYLGEGKLPDWERQNMLTKYYIISQAYKLSR